MNHQLTPSNLGYFVFNASDLTAWENFCVNLIGMQLSDRSSDESLILRIDNQEQRVVIEKGGIDDLVAIGWELESESALLALVNHISSSGVEINLASDELCTKRSVKKAYLCTDPNGVTHELYFGAAIAPLSKSFRSSVLIGDFLANSLGAGHYVAIAQNAEKTRHFYQNILCMRISDYIKGEVAPGGPILDATFMRTKTGRHHSVAFAEMPFPKKLHHFMLQVTDMNDVGLACQRCKEAQIPFFMELGHHPNDQMFSFYVQSPSGFGLEIGWGGIIVEEGKWEVKTYSQPSDWGHQHPEH
jgi:2,3-dihydroxybiphenyl 1,2-dioxygenase